VASKTVSNFKFKFWLFSLNAINFVVSLYQPFIEKNKDANKKEDEGDEEKPKRVFERENVFRKPFDDKE